MYYKLTRVTKALQIQKNGEKISPFFEFCLFCHFLSAIIVEDAENIFLFVYTRLFSGGIGCAVERTVAEIKHDVNRYHDEVDAIKDKHIPL